ncbi:TPA: hypothetical protein OUB44_001672 [Providencia rettgeri]|nr:hypothetical protein [Providencia rettgeri]
MYTHKFANIMIDVCKILGLLSKELDKKELRNHTDFISHQKFLDDAYNGIIEIIDHNKVINKDKRREYFYKYEQLYNQLNSELILSKLSKKEIMKKLTEITIPAIIALDMHITLNILSKDNSIHFYSYIEAFLFSDCYPHNLHDPKELPKGVRKYLKKIINNMKFPLIIDQRLLEIQIENIRASSNQDTKTFIQKIKICKLNAKRANLNYDNAFEKIKMAYISLNSMLTFENKTYLVQLVKDNYEKIINKKAPLDHPLNYLSVYIYKYLYNEGNVKLCSDEIISYAKLSNIKDEPPYARYVIEKINEIVYVHIFRENYTENDFLNIYKKLRECKQYPIFHIYEQFLDILYLLRHQNLNEAYRLINGMHLDEIPSNKLISSISIIKLALKIKLEQKKIKNGSLIPLINPILNNQIPHLNYALLRPEQLKNPIISNSNNMIIMRSIKLYNVMIYKISSLDGDNPDEFYPHAISGFLNKISITTTKLNHAIDNLKEPLTSENLAKYILNNKTLKLQEVTNNYFNIIKHSNLYNCLDCMSVLFDLLRANGEGNDLRSLLPYTDDISEKIYQRKVIICNALVIVENELRKNI